MTAPFVDTVTTNQPDDNVRRHLREALETGDYGEKQFHIRQALQYCDRTPPTATVREE